LVVMGMVTVAAARMLGVAVGKEDSKGVGCGGDGGIGVGIGGVEGWRWRWRWMCQWQ
jgi:hypothetical protein